MSKPNIEYRRNLVGTALAVTYALIIIVKSMLIMGLEGEFLVSEFLDMLLVVIWFGILLFMHFPRWAYITVGVLTIIFGIGALSMSLKEIIQNSAYIYFIDLVRGVVGISFGIVYLFPPDEGPGKIQIFHKAESTSEPPVDRVSQV